MYTYIYTRNDGRALGQGPVDGQPLARGGGGRSPTIIIVLIIVITTSILHQCYY